VDKKDKVNKKKEVNNKNNKDRANKVDKEEEVDKVDKVEYKIEQVIDLEAEISKDKASRNIKVYNNGEPKSNTTDAFNISISLKEILYKIKS